MYRFTQSSFQQNRRVTIDRIPEGTLLLDNEEDAYPNVDEIKEVYVNRLEKTNSKDISPNTDIDPIYSNAYGKITTEEL